VVVELRDRHGCMLWKGNIWLLVEKLLLPYPLLLSWEPPHLFVDGVEVPPPAEFKMDG
jgi:hypothetical protein